MTGVKGQTGVGTTAASDNDSSAPAAAEMRPWRAGSVLLWLVLAALLPGMIGATVLFLHKYRNGQEQLQTQTMATTRALTQAVDTELLKAQVLAQTLSKAGALGRGDFRTFHFRSKDLLELTHTGANVVLSDASGQQLVNTLRDYGEALPRHGNPEILKRVFESGQVVISDVYIGGVMRKPLMSIDVPVFIDGKVAYVLSIGLIPANFSRILSAQNMPPDWVVAIFDSSGTIVARTHFPERFVGQKGTPDYIKRIAERPEGAVESITREGIPVLSMWSRSPTTGWTVGIGIPRANLERELIRTLTLLGLAMAALLAVGLALAWGAGQRIARAFHALTGPAAALGEAGPVDIPQLEISEANEVAQALGRASTLLRQKTAALSDSNRSLLAAEAELSEAHRLARFGTWSWDMRTGATQASDSIREIYGREIPSFPEQRGTLLSIETWEKVNAAAQEVLQTGVGYDLEIMVNHGGGYPIWINAKCAPVRDADGSIVALRGTVQDITRRKATEQELIDSEARFRATFEQAAVGIAHISPAGRWLMVNDKLCAIVGHERETLINLSVQEITYAPDLEADSVLVQKLLAGAIPYYWTEKRYVRIDCTLVWVNLTVALVRHEDGTPNYFVVAVEDIQARKEVEAALAAHEKNLEQQVIARTAELTAANLQLESAVRKDALTGLQNRISANERLRQEFLRMKRTGEEYAVLFLDIDHFKAINDTYGHETGDHVLKQLASTLEGLLRGSDFVARFGGEEFLAILPCTTVDGACTLAEKIRRNIALQHFPAAGRITVSIGVACGNVEDANEDAAVRRADMALYQAKRAGRDAVRSVAAEGLR